MNLDALNATDRFGRTAHYDILLILREGVSAMFADAGHISGSACIRLEVEDAGASRRVSALIFA
jgi:hypothetical protein